MEFFHGSHATRARTSSLNNPAYSDAAAKRTDTHTRTHIHHREYSQREGKTVTHASFGIDLRSLAYEGVDTREAAIDVVHGNLADDLGPVVLTEASQQVMVHRNLLAERLLQVGTCARRTPRHRQLLWAMRSPRKRACKIIISVMRHEISTRFAFAFVWGIFFDAR